MRNITFILSILAILSFTSCKKNRTCNCITTITGATSSQSQKDVVIENISKKDGETKCNDMDSEFKDVGISEVYDCTLIK